jgi:hypothetical protein
VAASGHAAAISSYSAGDNITLLYQKRQLAITEMFNFSS